MPAVNRLAVLTEDGHVILCELEQLEPVQIQGLKVSVHRKFESFRQPLVLQLGQSPFNNLSSAAQRLCATFVTTIMAHENVLHTRMKKATASAEENGPQVLTTWKRT